MKPLTDKLYNVIKYTITIFLPAVGALYFGLAQVWNFNRIPGVNGTINVLITFGGLLIGYSTRQYKKSGTDGDLVVMQDEETGEKHIGLGVNGTSLEDMTSKSMVTLSVVDKTSTDPKMPLPVPSVIPGEGPRTNPAVSHIRHEQPPPPVGPTQS